MKNKFALISVFTLLLVAVLGCSSINPFKDKAKSNSASNKTLTDKAIDTTVGEETTGIPECDEVMELIAEEVNNPDDGYLIKAGKAMALNKVKESIRKGIEENKSKDGTADMAKTCRDYKKQVEKYKAEEESKKGQ